MYSDNESRRLRLVRHADADRRASSAACRAARRPPSSCSTRASTAPSTRSARTASPRRSTPTATAACRSARGAASARPTSQDRIAAFWFPNTSQAGGGFALWQARGTLPGSQHANMMPQAAQSGASLPDLSRRPRRPAAERGAGVGRPGQGPQGSPRLVGDGAERDLRPRLDPPDRARQQRRDPPPAVERPRRPRRAARHSRPVGRRHPDLSRRASRRRVDFADNSFLDWDYGYLPPGTWTITAQGSSASRTATLNIDAAPVVSVLDPDVEGGRDFATTVIGDAWDLTNAQDVQRNNATLHHLDSADVRRERPARHDARRQLRERLRRRHLPRSVRPVPRRRLRLRPGGHRRQHLSPAVVHARLRPPGADDRPGPAATRGAASRASRGRGRTAPATRRPRSRRTSSSSTAARPATRWTWRRSSTATTLEAPIATLWTGQRSGRSASTSTRARRRARSACRTSSWRPTTRRTAAASSRSAGGSPTPPTRAGVADTGGGDATVALYYDTDLNPATKTLIASGVNAASRPVLLEHGRPRARRLLRLRRGHRRHRQLAGPLLDRSGPGRRGDSGRHRQQRQRPRRRVGDASTACRTRARTTTATASRTSPNTRPARIRASRTSGRCRKARPASSPSASRWPTRTRRPPTSR